MQHLDTNETRRLTTHEADESEPSFSPDGTRIAYYSSRDGGGVYTVSTFGGEERKVAALGRGPRYSPDGKWIAYWTGIPRDVDMVATGGEIYVVPAQGGAPKRMATDLLIGFSPIWSPDSTRLLAKGTKKGDPFFGNWYIVPMDGGPSTGVLAFGRPARPLTRRLATWWDRNRIYFSANSGDERGIWSLALPDDAGQAKIDAAEPVPANSAEDAAVFGAQIVYTRRTENADIWTLPIHADAAKVTGEPKRITTDVSPEWNCGITPDGTGVVYVSYRSAEMHIFLQDLRTGQSRKLTQGANIAQWARINRDGTLVAFSTFQPQKVFSHVLEVSSGTSKQVCEMCQLRAFSSDGTGVWVTGRGTNNPMARSWLVSVADGSERAAFESKAAGAPRPSADDRWMALYDSRPGGASQTKMLIIPLRPGSVPVPESEWIPVTDGTTYDVIPEFSPNGEYLYFQSRRDGFQCIWAQRLDAKTKRPLRAPFPVQHFHQSQRSPSYVGPGRVCNAVAADKIAFTMAERTGNIWIAELPK